jgi:hypothetical protein
MANNFDVKELRKIFINGYEKVPATETNDSELLARINAAMEKSLLAVAAHVREQTLREAAGVVPLTQTETYNAILALAASARETGGKLTVEQSAARLHEKYGDALAKMDDKDGGKC